MKIRSKLLFYYGVIIAALVVASIISLFAVSGWRTAADRLIGIHYKSAIAEKLRSSIFLQVNFALDFLYGDPEAKGRFDDAYRQTLELVDQLKADSLIERELDFIEDFEATQSELKYIINRFFESRRDQTFTQSLPEARARLREIVDEVADDVASLSQFYDTQESIWLAAATDAGSMAVGIIVTASIAAVSMFIILMFFLQRWLVKPIAVVSGATNAISGGDLDNRIPISSDDEWAQLSVAINDMAHSLKTTLAKLSEQERLAALGEISAYAAHNIRNPLAGVRAAVQVLLDDKSSLPPPASESLEEIINTIDRLDGWLRRLLEFARPLGFEPAPQDVNRLFSEAVDIAFKPFANGSTKLEWDLAQDIPPVSVDGILLEQAIAAIATNAFQAISGNGIVKCQSAIKPGENGGDTVILRISDNGVGVPEHIKPRLFRIFESSKDKGTGLGLAQVKRIIDLHGGSIELTSEQGKGTTVEITLPMGGNQNGIPDTGDN